MKMINKKLVLMLTLLILTMPLAFALNFDVTCDEDIEASTPFNCVVTLAEATSEGLAGLTFSIDTSMMINSVEVAGLDTSVPPYYGFMSMTPLSTVGDLVATISLTTSSAATLQIEGVYASTADYSEIPASELIFPAVSVELGGSIPTTCEEQTCALGWHCEMIDGNPACVEDGPITCEPACENGGTCDTGGATSFCDCTGTGYTGAQCQTLILDYTDNNGVCEDGEPLDSVDCQPPDTCGDGTCDANEDELTCAEDCDSCFDLDCDEGYHCELGACVATVFPCSSTNPCGVGGTCTGNSDCLSNNCFEGVCQELATCDDGLQNGEETGIDCGGECAPCEAQSIISGVNIHAVDIPPILIPGEFALFNTLIYNDAGVDLMGPFEVYTMVEAISAEGFQEVIFMNFEKYYGSIEAGESQPAQSNILIPAGFTSLKKTFLVYHRDFPVAYLTGVDNKGLVVEYAIN
jgi:hypothetical protein